jgi:hypothetical protein
MRGGEDRTHPATRDASIDAPLVAQDAADPARLLDRLRLQTDLDAPATRSELTETLSKARSAQNFVVAKRTIPVMKIARQMTPTTASSRI